MSSVEPISGGSEYRCIADFEKALVEWETKYGHQFRVGSSENLKNKYGMKDEVFEYRVLVLQCVHFGNPRERAGQKRKRSSCAHLPCGCTAMLRLNFSMKEQLLRITSLIDVHTGHELEPGKRDGRKSLSQRRKSVKRARMSDAVDLPPVVQDLDWGIKPKMPFPMISAMAIYNSSKGHLLTKEIYLFFETYFPFFRTAYGSWKNSVRHALHTHAYFHKKMGKNKDKENLVFSLATVEKFLEDVAAFVARYPDRTMKIYGLANSEHWDLMVKAELKNSAVTLHRPKAIFPKKIKMEPEVEEEEADDDMEEFVIIDAPEGDVKPKLAEEAPVPAPLPMQNPFLPQQPLNMQMPLLQNQFNLMQYPLQGPLLQLPGINDYAALAQAAAAVNYNDIRLL